MNNMVIFVSVILLIIFLLVTSNTKKVNLGEEKVSSVLNEIIGYKLLNDVMIKTEKGTSQIDHILIGKKGVFVIETKDFNGSIYGDEFSKYWTQVLNKSNNKFYNPIRQNYGHVKSIERCINRKNIYISIIVFTDKSILKKVETETPVIQLKKLRKFIKSYKSNIRLSNKEVNEIYTLINKSNIKNRKEREKHVKRINKIS